MASSVACALSTSILGLIAARAAQGAGAALVMPANSLVVAGEERTVKALLGPSAAAQTTPPSRAITRTVIAATKLST
jgi:hypothetical protein